MKLLIVTQKVSKNDDVLGFFHRWIAEFAAHVEFVTVICLEKGEYDLPQNVRVLSLGKEMGICRLKYLSRFYWYIASERANYDVVFVHMNPVYVVLGAPVWHLWKKKIALWYTHRNVDWTLRVATHYADMVFTATQASFRIKTPKLKILGHGIFTEDLARPSGYKNDGAKKVTLVSVGRLTPIKNLDILIEATALLRGSGVDCEVLLVGGAIMPGDDAYVEYLRKIIREKRLEDVIHFVGSVPNKEVMQYYWKSDISINLAPTGGIDKAVLESMAAGTPAIVVNKAFTEYFGAYKDDLIFKEGDAKDLSIKIHALVERKDKDAVTEFLVRAVREKGSATMLIQRIIENIS